MYSIVLVDDEIYTLNGIKKTFDWANYDFDVVAAFTDPIEALSYIEKNKPDIVFFDIEMPEMSGIELLKRMREKGIKSKAVIVSAHSDFKYAQAAISYDVFEYLLKPINREKGEALLKRLKKSMDMNSKYYLNLEEDDNFAVIKNERFKMLVSYIHNHSNEPLNLNSLAESFDLNATYCSRLFLKYYSCNFTEYLRNIRMSKACDLLKLNYDVSDVAEKVGYSDYFHFCKSFKKVYGITPYKFKTINKI